MIFYILIYSVASPTTEIVTASGSGPQTEQTSGIKTNQIFESTKAFSSPSSPVFTTESNECTIKTK